MICIVTTFLPCSACHQLILCSSAVTSSSRLRTTSWQIHIIVKSNLKKISLWKIFHIDFYYVFISERHLFQLQNEANLNKKNILTKSSLVFTYPLLLWVIWIPASFFFPLLLWFCSKGNFRFILTLILMGEGGGLILSRFLKYCIY